MLPSVHRNVNVLIEAGLEYRPGLEYRLGVWHNCANRGRGGFYSRKYGIHLYETKNNSKRVLDLTSITTKQQESEKFAYNVLSMIYFSLHKSKLRY